MGRPYSLTTKQLFEMAELIRGRHMTNKDIAHKYGISPYCMCRFFTGNGKLTDKSLMIIKNELLKQIRSNNH